MIHFTPQRRTIQTLKAIAASGSTGLARQAQAELKARREAELREYVEAQRAAAG